MLRKKLPRIWRIENTLQLRENIENQRRKNFLRSRIRNHVQWVHREIKYEDHQNYWYLLKIRKYSMILTQRAVMTIPRSSSSSCDLEFKKAWPLSWNAAVYTRRYEYSWKRFFDCQPARRVPDELHNDSRKLAASLVILRTEGIEKIESEEPLQSTPHLAFLWKHDKNIDDGKCPLLGTCTQGVTIPSYLPSEMHPFSLPHTHATGDRETTWEENGRRKKISPWTKASPAPKAKNPLSTAGKMKKYRRATIDIIPCAYK